ncbi:T9SS type A sorting domain-containing protein [Fulvivirga sp.]|uniref:T9SS type A sorting domain-containing protein n=1 Tax=Fulvivirga sp. TaxID=1931237 RepID=UPI0032EF5071
MKMFFSAVLILISGLFLQAQNFEVAETSEIFKGKVGEKIVAQIPIKNLSDRPIQLVIKRLDKVIGTSQTTYFCWDGQCQPSTQDILPISKRLSASETSLKLESVLEAGLVPGISSVKYLIYNRDNPAEAVEYEVNYTIEENDEGKILYSSADVKLKDIYPNPITEYAIIDYELINENTNAKIVLHNVLGSVVGEYVLAPYESKLKINADEFNPGVYFYTLYIDNDGVITHKLIIRK